MIILNPLNTRKTGFQEHTILASTAIKRFQNGKLFDWIGKPDDSCIVDKWSFESGQKIYLKWGKGLTNLVSYIVTGDDIHLEEV